MEEVERGVSMERLTKKNGNSYEKAKTYITHQQLVDKLADYEDAEEQGLLLRLDSKDELVEILATKLFNSEFGVCYMCTNPMKNVTLDGVNNGCNGECNTSEEFTVDDFLKKIVSEIEYRREKALADMGV